MVVEPGYITEKQAVLSRLHRIEGQIRGLQRLVDEEQYCTDILTQLAAATKALEGVALMLLDQHLRHCFMQAADPAEGPAGAQRSLRSDPRLVC